MTAVVTGTRLPHPKEVRDLLEDLLGRDVTVAPGDPVTPGPTRPVALAVYVDPASTVTAVAMVDLPLSAWCAGALALLPRGGVADAVDEGALPDLLVEVLHEVLNVAASLLNTPGAPHARLDRLVAPGEPWPADLAGLTASTDRLDLTVSVAGYGTGGLSVVLG